MKNSVFGSLSLADLERFLLALEGKGVSLPDLLKLVDDDNKLSQVAQSILSQDKNSKTISLSPIESVEEELIKALPARNFFSPKDWLDTFGPDCLSDKEVRFPSKVLKQLFSPAGNLSQTDWSNLFLVYLPFQFRYELLNVKSWLGICRELKISAFKEADFLEFKPKPILDVVPRYEWCFFTKNILPGSDKKTLEQQKEMLPKGFELPNMAELIAFNFLYSLKTKQGEELVMSRSNDWDGKDKVFCLEMFSKKGAGVFSCGHDSRHENLGIFAILPM